MTDFNVEKEREALFECEPHELIMRAESFLDEISILQEQLNMVSKNCSIVYCHVTGWALSKPNTCPEYIIEFHDRMMDRLEEKVRSEYRSIVAFVENLQNCGLAWVPRAARRVLRDFE